MSLNSFSCRVGLLLGLMLAVSWWDFHRHGAQAAKFREYGFILLTGAIGGAVGFVNDWMTSSISPDYFVWGKGLEETPDLRMQAALFGLRVGFSAGVIGGAVWLYAGRRKAAPPPARFSSLLRLLWLPVAGAILGGLLLPMGCSRFDPFGFAAQLDGVLTAAGIVRFREVWWIHVGLYAGLLAGLAAMIIRIVRQRRRSQCQNKS